MGEALIIGQMRPRLRVCFLKHIRKIINAAKSHHGIMVTSVTKPRRRCDMYEDKVPLMMLRRRYQVVKSSQALAANQVNLTHPSKALAWADASPDSCTLSRFLVPYAKRVASLDVKQMSN